MKKLFLLFISLVIMQNITKAQVGCHAFLGYYQTPGTTVVTFYDSSNTTSGRYNSTGTYINFGNGTTQHFSSLGGTYTMQYTAGTYHVCLYIQDSLNQNCTDSFCQTVSVTASGSACVASFSIWADSLIAGLYYGSNNSTTSGTNPTYTWTWGDGSSSTGAYPSHTYASSGTYTICLHTSSQVNGMICKDSMCITQVIARMKGANAMHSITILDPQHPLGISNVAMTNKLSVYPNPASTELNIDIKGEKIETIKIISINGQTMNNVDFVNNKISISKLVSNIYFVEVRTINNVYRARFIKE
ncbi:MAG: hypothetical protein RJA07_615 [Bacteroidota bacterium]|jgi:PKD repeat protein